MNPLPKLNPSELKSQLYHSLQQKGVLDAMKLQLRNRLVKELKQVSTVPKSLSVLESLTHAIILEHLRKMGYEYTISLFALESGMGANQNINSTDLMKLLKIDSRHPLHKSFMNESQISEQGFLTTLLLSLPQLASLQQVTIDVGTQVDVPVEEESTNQQSRFIHLSLEQRILLFEKECEERTQKAMEEKISQFKNGELLRVKMDCKENLKRELQAKRSELERQYQEKMEQLAKRERDMVQRSQRREEELEASLYSQRQLVLQELELIRQREDHLIKQSDLNKLQFSDLHSTSERLKQEEQILKTEVNRKQELLDQLQNQLAARTTEVSTVRQQYEDVWKECTTLRSALISSKEEVHTATEQLVGLQNQKLLLEQKLKEGENYDQLKAENEMLKNELVENKHKSSEYSANTGRLITDQQQLICELKEQLHKPATQLATLQQQLDSAHVEHKQALMLKDLHIKRLEHQLTAQASVSQRVLAQEQSHTPRWRQDSVMSKSILKSSPSKLGKTAKPPKSSKSAKLLKPRNSDTEEDSLSTSQTRYRSNLKDLSSFDKASKKFLEEMKETFLRLEKEAKELEEQHPTNGHHHLPNVPYSTTVGYTSPLSSHHWHSFPLTEPPSLPSLSNSASSTMLSSLNIPTHLNLSTFASVSSLYSINGLPSTTKPYTSSLMSSHSYADINLLHRPVMSVTFPDPSTTQFQPVHLTSGIHVLPVTHTLTTVATLTHPLSSVAPQTHPLTTVATLTHPLTTVATSIHPLTSGAPLTHPITTVAHPLTSVVTLTHPVTTAVPPTHPPTTIAILTHPITTIATLTHPITTVATLTHPITNVTYSLPTSTSSVTTTQPVISSLVPQASIYALTTTTDPQARVNAIATSTGLTKTAFDSSTSVPPTATIYHQASSSSILTTSRHHSVVTSPSHSMATQPHLLSTTMTIQEDSLTKDLPNSSDISESTEDGEETPKSTEEGTLAAVLALRDQYSPVLSSSIATVSQQPPMVSLDNLWSSRGNPTTEEPRDDVDNDTVTHHSDMPPSVHTTPLTVTASVTTPTHHPAVITTSARSSSPPTVTAVTTSQSLDNTMGRYLQLLQQKQQAEENSQACSVTHNSDKEEESLVTCNTSDNGAKISDDGFEDW